MDRNSRVPVEMKVPSRDSRELVFRSYDWNTLGLVSNSWPLRGKQGRSKGLVRDNIIAMYRAAIRVTCE